MILLSPLPPPQIHSTLKNVSIAIPEDHKFYLNDAQFQDHLDINSLTAAEAQILKRYGYWMTALVECKISPISEAQQRFLSVNEGIQAPVTEFELAWMNYRTACMSSEVLYGRALKLQRSGTSENTFGLYERICEAFQAAAEAGSIPAKRWAKEQGLTYIKPNSLWTRPIGGGGGQVNNQYIDEINRSKDR